MSATKKARPSPKEKSVPPRSVDWRAPVICVALAAMTFAVFGQTLGHPFVNYDDNDYIYLNPMVSQGLTKRGLAWAFGFHAFNWHPLTWLSHMLDCQVYKLHPGGHHLTNVLLHTATVIALFLVLRAMTGAVWRSAFVAAVFAIHPLRVESVAWVAERKDVLSGFFFILTMGAYLRYVRGKRPRIFFGLSLLCFALGLMAKPMLVTVPIVLLLLDYWPLQRKEAWRKRLLEKLPFIGLSAASCVVTLYAQTGAIHSFGPFTLAHRLGNAVVAVTIYLWQMVWPAGLTLLYPMPMNGQPSWLVALSSLLLAGVSIVVWKARRARPWLLCGWLWYLVMLLPVIGIIQVGAQAHADRYTYLPQIGVYIALVWLAGGWRFQRATATAAVACVAVLMVCAWNQTGYWRDSVTLWEHTLAYSVTDVAHYNLGDALLDEKKVDEAIDQYKNALEINPDCVQALIDLGTALRQKGKWEEAVSLYQKALQLKPDDSDAHSDLATALRQLGRVDDAISHFRRALQISPGDAKIHFDLGNALLQKGDVNEAIFHYQTALEIWPGYEKAHNNLGTAFLKKGKTEEAAAQFQRAVQLNPDDPDALNNLAWVLSTSAEASQRNGARAVELAERANEAANGKNPLYLHTLAAAYAEAGRFDQAVGAVKRAGELAAAAGQQNLMKQLNSELNHYLKKQAMRQK